MQREILKVRSYPNVLPIRKKVAAYARVLSEKESMLHSLSAQISYYSELIQNNPSWRYVGVYADEAKTGTKGERPEFQRLLEDCKQGKIDTIIIYLGKICKKYFDNIQLCMYYMMYN